LLRALFFALPPRLQLVLEPVRVTPFSARACSPTRSGNQTSTT